MDSILESIKALRGVYEVCVYHNNQVLGSTIPPEQQVSIHTAVQMLEHVFSALESIQQDHEEMYIAIGDKLLVAYHLQGWGTVLLLTEKRVNIPLIHMGVKSAGNKLKAALVTEVAAPQPVAATVTANPSRVLLVKAAPVDIDILPILDKLQALLLGYFGPAASFIFSDALDEWKQREVPKYQNLRQLVNLLLTEFDSEQEMRSFQRSAEAIISAGKLTKII